MAGSGSRVVKRYQKIFGDDPLLLQEHNQEDYGKAMLEHILLYRPMTTSTPTEVDLHDDKSRLDFRRLRLRVDR